jgi:hypothetical protein
MDPDPILYWNDVALEANRESHTNGNKEQTGPPLSARALAIVHLAAYDAYAGASANPPELRPYLPGLPPAPAGASPDAAVASAVHSTLSALFPSQRPFFDAKLAAAPVTGTPAQVSAGSSYGHQIAQALLLDRHGDPGVGDDGYVPSTARGRHRHDPENPDQGYHAPFYGERARCFAVTQRHALDKPPMPGDADYRSALRQVRGKGIAEELMGTVPNGVPKRTIDETVIGLFWAYDGAKGLGTPPRLYNQIVRKVAEAKGNTPAQNARLFALINAAMADAGILAWEQKYYHDLWRPVVGIREHDTSMGLEGAPGNNLSDDGDPLWRPLGAPATNDVDKRNSPRPSPRTRQATPRSAPPPSRSLDGSTVTRQPGPTTWRAG